MTDPIVANQLGALGQLVADRQQRAVHAAVGLSGEAAAGVIALAAFPGERVTFFEPIVGLTSAGTVRLVSRLESAGLVGRHPGADGRSSALRLTAKGRRAHRRIVAAREESLTELLATLDPSQVAALHGALTTMLAASATDRDAARRTCRLCRHEVCDHAGRCPVDEVVSAAGHPHWTPPARRR